MENGPISSNTAQIIMIHDDQCSSNLLQSSSAMEVWLVLTMMAGTLNSSDALVHDTFLGPQMMWLRLESRGFYLKKRKTMVACIIAQRSLVSLLWHLFAPTQKNFSFSERKWVRKEPGHACSHPIPPSSALEVLFLSLRKSQLGVHFCPTYHPVFLRLVTCLTR